MIFCADFRPLLAQQWSPQWSLCYVFMFSCVLCVYYAPKCGSFVVAVTTWNAPSPQLRHTEQSTPELYDINYLKGYMECERVYCMFDKSERNLYYTCVCVSVGTSPQLFLRRRRGVTDSKRHRRGLSIVGLCKVIIVTRPIKEQSYAECSYFHLA